VSGGRPSEGSGEEPDFVDVTSEENARLVVVVAPVRTAAEEAIASADVDELLASLTETLETLDVVVRDLTERLAEGAAIYENDPVFRHAVTRSPRKTRAERVGDKSLKKKLRKQTKKAEKQKLGKAVEKDGHQSREPGPPELQIPPELARKIVADYDRRVSTRWGRFLMWLLRKTT
jgi:hypothetical protein